MERSPSSQAGIGFVMVIIIGAFLGLGGIYGFKIGKTYFDKKALKDIVQIKLAEGRDQKHSSEEIHRRIWDSTNVNSMNIPFDTITVERTDDGKIVAEVKWVPEIPLWTNAKLVLLHSFKDSVVAPSE